MQKLVEGLHKFQSEIFELNRDLFEHLSKGQAPEVLFITCSDSRVVPNLITQTEPGDLFVLRNAGNIVPPYGASSGGEAATIEYAVSVLGVKDIVICGHTHCGAMKGLLHPESLSELTAVRSWLSHAEATARLIKDNYTHLNNNPDGLLSATIAENVLTQIENLRTHPSVRSKVSNKQLTLHAWVYHFEKGQVFHFDPKKEQFAPLEYVRPVKRTA
jgi:carbonic anhydrase